MITLYQPPPAWGLPNISPFCVKLEAYLRMAKIEYKVAMGNPYLAPKKKIPYVKIDGEIMGDSSLVIKRLKEKYGDPLDQGLTDEQKALALSLQRLMEDHLYFAGAWLRWSDETSWTYVRDFFRPLLPKMLSGWIVNKMRKNFLKALWAQGTGRHSRDEIIAFAKEDLGALSVLLADKPYFLGPRATTIDATMYGFLIQQLWVPWESPLKAYIRTLPNLIRYCERMKQQYWSENRPVGSF